MNELLMKTGTSRRLVTWHVGDAWRADGQVVPVSEFVIASDSRRVISIQYSVLTPRYCHS